MAWKVLSLSVTQEINSICNDLKVSTTRADSVDNTYIHILPFNALVRVPTPHVSVLDWMILKSSSHSLSLSCIYRKIDRTSSSESSAIVIRDVVHFYLLGVFMKEVERAHSHDFESCGDNSKGSTYKLRMLHFFTFQLTSHPCACSIESIDIIQ
jgi:hypothetical protein